MKIKIENISLYAITFLAIISAISKDSDVKSILFTIIIGIFLITGLYLLKISSIQKAILYLIIGIVFLLFFYLT